MSPQQLIWIFHLSPDSDPCSTDSHRHLLGDPPHYTHAQGLGFSPCHPTPCLGPPVHFPKQGCHPVLHEACATPSGLVVGPEPTADKRGVVWWVGGILMTPIPVQ